jgi:hypothetical protein
MKWSKPMPSNEQPKPGKHGRPKPNADESIISALVLGGSYDSAAKHAGVSIATVVRRVRSAAFQSKLMAARAEIVRQSVDRAASFGNMALNTLMRLMDSPNDAVALGAARSLVEVAFRMKESASFEERLSELENEVGSGQGNMRRGA